MKSDRVGLVLIAASLAVIAALIGLLYSKSNQLHRDKVRAQGVALARALSGAQLSQLVPARGQKDIVATLANVQAGDGFAYAAVVSKSGEKLYEFTAPGSIVPVAAMPAEPAAWFGERPLVSPGDGRQIREFFAPVLQGSELAGFVRAGYYERLQATPILEISYAALMALPVLLLMAFSYLLIRREIRPLAALARKLEDARELHGLQLGLPHGPDFGRFAYRFDAFVDAIVARIQHLERRSREAQTANQLLSYQHDKAQAILDAIPDAVLVLDDAAAVAYANPMAGVLLGVDARALSGKPLRDWCARPEVLGLVNGFADPVGSPYGAVVEYSPAAQPEHRMSVAAYPLFAPRDRAIVYGTLLVFRDVSEQYAGRHAGMEFVAQVSHELKTPLTTITTFGELLLEYDKLSADDRVEAVNGIHGEARRAATLISDLLNVFKLDAGTMPIERQRVKLYELLCDLVQSHGKRARSSGVTLELAAAPELGSAKLDKDLFRIAIDNLVSNAIKYSRPGGRVTLGAQRLADDRLRITVTDDGIGISAEDRNKVFDKYYRSSSSEVASRTGHGLGLYLTRRIVELHHGRVSLQSELGKGSEFSIEFEAAAVPLESHLPA